MTRERPRPILSEPPTGTIDKQEPAAEQPRRSFAQHLKDLFGRVAEAVAGKPTPTLAAKRKRRREETGRAFNMLRAAVVEIKGSLFRFMYSCSRHDRRAERVYAEHVLREQMEEWSREAEQQQDERLHYGSTTSFDPQP